MIEKKINDKVCRIFYKYQLWVSNDGEFVGREVGNTISPLRILTDKYGNRHVIVKGAKGKTEFPHIDEMVMLCFLGRNKDTSKPYYVAHKDNNKANCHIDNLEWRIKPYRYNNADKVSLNRTKGATVIVNKDGRIQQKGKYLPILDSSYDADVDLWKIINPYVPVQVPHRSTHAIWFIDELMDESGFVHGNKYAFNKPVILHRDYDWKNFHTDNLEFVEENDSRYLEYRKIMYAAMNERVKEENEEVEKLPDFIFHNL